MKTILTFFALSVFLLVSCATTSSSGLLRSKAEYDWRQAQAHDADSAKNYIQFVTSAERAFDFGDLKHDEKKQLAARLYDIYRNGRPGVPPDENKKKKYENYWLHAHQQQTGENSQSSQKVEKRTETHATPKKTAPTQTHRSHSPSPRRSEPAPKEKNQAEKEKEKSKEEQERRAKLLDWYRKEQP